jgi:predicted kinase
VNDAPPSPGLALPTAVWLCRRRLMDRQTQAHIIRTHSQLRVTVSLESNCTECESNADADVPTDGSLTDVTD